MPEPLEPFSPPEVDIVATVEAEQAIRDRGGLLFIWPRFRFGARGALTFLEAATEPPANALDFKRIEAGRILVFLSPFLRRIPRRLEVETRGWRRKRLRAYWDGCEFAA